MKYGKQVAGPTNYIPKIHFWGGAMFISCFRRSVFFFLPRWIIEWAAILGFDLMGD